MKVAILHPATFKLDGGAMFGIIPKPLWEKKITPDEFNRINMSMRVLYFEFGDRKILVDTGIGDYHSEKFIHQFDIKCERSPLVNALKDLDLSTDDITDIVLTHLHFDHVGGLGTGEHGTDIIFENAILHVHQKHLEYAQIATKRDAGSFHVKTFMPLIEKYKNKKKLNLVTEGSGSLVKNEQGELNFMISFGHTPYMLHPFTDQYIYLADLIPMGHHLNIPWVMGYDIEPGVTTVYKEKFLKFIEEKKLTMIFEHDIDTWGGKLGKNDKGRTVLVDKQLTSNKRVQII